MIHRFWGPRLSGRNETIWLTVYADLMTNLMLVFLALYGLTVMGEDAVSKAVQSMKLEDLHRLSEQDIRLAQLAPKLRVVLEDMPAVKVSEDDDAVRIQLGEEALFPSGSASLRAGARDPLIAVGLVVAGVPNPIVVEGHSDSQPLPPTSRYRDNWELSLERAMAVIHMLSGPGTVPASRLAAAAYGPYRPRGDNATDAGRRLNRRVEIAILKDAIEPAFGPIGRGRS